MSHTQDRAIGGYHELELPHHEENLTQGMIRTNSARSAIKLVLSSVGAKTVWLPNYICGAVVEAARSLGITTEFYELDANLEIDSALCLRKDEYILIVDYFGLCSEGVLASVRRFGARQTIIDCAQAYFTQPANALATIYSPRKFFGLPDGGLLYSKDARIQQPQQRDTSSESRMAHLISRLGNSAEAGYQQYLNAERTIAKLPTQGMSPLTERLLRSVDYERSRAARARNACYLHEQLGHYNQLKLRVGDGTAPLCYPLLPNVKAASRESLIRQRVYLPTYWPEVLNRVQEGSFEWNLVTNCLLLPCDQRYNAEDMDRLVNLLEIN